MAAADETAAELTTSDNALVAVLRDYDVHFREGLWHEQSPSALAIVLFMNAYAIFLAGVRVALSGHCAATFPLLRTALESAAYGRLMVQSPELQDVWTHRHRSVADKKACRNAFTFDKAIASLKTPAPDIYALASLGYEGAIDFGAHPNIRGVFTHITLEDQREDGFTAIHHTSLYSANHIETIRGLCACLDFGFAIIGIIMLSSHHISEEMLADLNCLNAAKNAATEPYRADPG